MSELPARDSFDDSAQVPRVTKEKLAIGARIRDLRESRSLTQDDLAGRVSKKSQQIWRYENGWNKPSGQVVVDLAEALGSTARYIMYGEMDPLPIDEATDTPGWQRFVELGMYGIYLEKGLDRGQLEFVRGARFKAGPPDGPEPYVEFCELLLKAPVSQSAEQAMRAARTRRAQRRKKR